MAKLTLTLSDDEIQVVLKRDIVRVVAFEDEPDYDEARHRVACRISDCTPDQPFILTLDEAQALVEAISERPTFDFSERENLILSGLIGPLDFLDGDGSPL